VTSSSCLLVGKIGPVMKIPPKLVHVEVIMWTPRVYFIANLDHLPGTNVNIVAELTFCEIWTPS